MAKQVNYQVNSMDVCVSGFERLRSNREFIILTSIGPDVTYEVLKADLLRDISSCERGENYDAIQCATDLNAWLDDNVKPAFDRSPNPFGLEQPDEDDADSEGCQFFVYMQQTEDETADA